MKLSSLQCLYIRILRHIKITLEGIAKSCQIILEYLEFIFFVYVFYLIMVFIYSSFYLCTSESYIRI